jgi:hypothetical protein
MDGWRSLVFARVGLLTLVSLTNCPGVPPAIVYPEQRREVSRELNIALCPLRLFEVARTLQLSTVDCEPQFPVPGPSLCWGF